MMKLRIADITIGVSTGDSKAGPLDDKFDLFTVDVDEKPVSFQVEIQIGNLPDLSETKKLFHSGMNWSLFTRGAMRYMTMDHADMDHPVWISSFLPEKETCTVYIDKRQRDRLLLDGRLMNPFRSPLDKILFTYIVAERKGVLLHASGVEINGKSYVFPGRSGAGKTTLSRLLTTDSRFTSLCDEYIAVRQREDEFIAYATPWTRFPDRITNKQAPLAGVLFPIHGERNRVVPLTAQQTMERLIPVLSTPWFDPPMSNRSLDTCEAMIRRVPGYLLEFKPDKKVVSTLLGHVFSDH